jgi:hypothetical protein
MPISRQARIITLLVIDTVFFFVVSYPQLGNVMDDE